jgi:hypothetical protein
MKHTFLPRYKKIILCEEKMSEQHLSRKHRAFITAARSHLLAPGLLEIHMNPQHL